jgi:hypothetical protein
MTRPCVARQPVTATMLRKFAATARERMLIEGGDYRRDHLRALAPEGWILAAKNAGKA